MDIGFESVIEENKVMPKVLINVGSLFDIPTGAYITGTRGESILNGGLGQLVAIFGAGNNFKSTISHYLMLTSANRMVVSYPTAMMTYDTEVNISIDRLQHFARVHPYLPNDPIVSDKPIWGITDKSKMYANTWWDKTVEYATRKSKNKSNLVEYEAFTNPYTKKRLVLPVPTYGEVDSWTEFEGENTGESVKKDIIGSNTLYMQQGLFKNKVIGILPRIANEANIHFIFTGHIGSKIDMATGPAMYQQPTKVLQYLKSGDAMKGATGKLSFLSTASWQAHTATLLKNPTTKLPEYPRSKDDTLETDLNVVRLTMLRSKNGPSGYTIEIVLTQTEGVLPTLTEFHHIKNNGRFGLGGNDRSYFLDILPEVTLSRTTVRNKIDNNANLQRAINITSELLQLSKFHPNLKNLGLLCTPEELYTDIKNLGYDWDMLLQTRGWWTIKQYSADVVPYLSTMDLLKIRAGKYQPYFLDKDKKVKKDWIKYFKTKEEKK